MNRDTGQKSLYRTQKTPARASPRPRNSSTYGTHTKVPPMQGFQTTHVLSVNHSSTLFDLA